MRVLLLGGTTDAGELARALADAGCDAVYSYAGRTARPLAQPLPTRVGGFGGAEGLAAYLGAAGITHVVDATHPFAIEMSRNATAACASTGVPLIGFERAAWRPGPGDAWRSVPTVEAAAIALPDAPGRVFLAIGRRTIGVFAARPEHFYLLRFVDAPDGPMPLPACAIEVGRGPFTVAADAALMRRHGITCVVSKNAGGDGARAKLEAARELGVPVIMIERPQTPERPVVRTAADVMAWLGHSTRRGV